MGLPRGPRTANIILLRLSMLTYSYEHIFSKERNNSRRIDRPRRLCRWLKTLALRYSAGEDLTAVAPFHTLLPDSPSRHFPPPPSRKKHRTIETNTRCCLRVLLFLKLFHL